VKSLITNKIQDMLYISNSQVSSTVKKADRESRLAIRNQIESYEESLKSFLGSEKGEMDDINNKGLKEHFIEGAYIRELFIPKGTTIVSKLWNRARFWIIASGDVTFITELGKKRVKGPYTQVAPFGSKVALYTHEDTLWFAITGAISTTPEDVEKEVVAKDYTEFTYPWDMLEDKGVEV